MAMGINTNQMSLNAQRQSSTAQAALGTAMARLSSGMRINTAKDDAAGLAIGERMNTQVRGMTVAIRNANDGISMTQTAEGGLSTVVNMLQRMRELAVQASNSTNNSNDLSAMDREYQQLSQEIARTVSSTQFNGMSILTAGTDMSFQVGANADSTQTITVLSSDLLVGDALTAVMVSGDAQASILDTSDYTQNVNRLTALDEAIRAVNEQRAGLGAMQSRFDNTISNLQTSVENQTAARGRIMDADFAAESAALSRAQILSQASTAMIAQANQAPQSVMKLLN